MFPLTFAELAMAGLVDTARGIIRGLQPAGIVNRQGPAATAATKRLLQIGRARGAVDYETARSITRRAIAGINTARRMENSDRRIPRGQHGFDPFFQQFGSREYVYRVIVVCFDEGADREVRTPVDVVSDRTLTGSELRAQALDAYARGLTTINPHQSDFRLIGSCGAPRVIFVFAVRSTE